MKNVYDAVKAFYEQDPAWNDIIRNDLVEGFLRQKAWQHYDDKHLRSIWQHILMFGLYMAYADLALNQVKLIDCEEMKSWLERNVADFKSDKNSLLRFFTTLVEFYDYLANRRIVEKSNLFKKELDYIDGNKSRLRLAGNEKNNMSANFFSTPDAPSPIYLRLDEHLQEILLLLNNFYQQADYMADFERAIFLYHGIMGWDEEDLENRKQDFWLGFWDYFLFDYRLITNDKSPIRNFKENGDFPADAKPIIDEMMNARFSVFFVKNTHTQDWLECEDLLTGATFFLPNPIENINGIKDLLFMGHLFSDNMVLVNYVLSVPVSPKLRQRIKDQMNKLYKFFLVQEPSATWSDFIERHAVAMRHSVDIFTNFSKLNIVGEITEPQPLEHNYSIVDASVLEALCSTLAKNLFSFRDIEICCRMWIGFCSQKKNFHPKRPELWAAGVAASFVAINSAFEMDYTYIAEIFKTEPKQVREYQKKIDNLLGIKEADLRYLSEEGFIMLLLSQ